LIQIKPGAPPVAAKARIRSGASFSILMSREKSGALGNVSGPHAGIRGILSFSPN
jgi:hypothetical protein